MNEENYEKFVEKCEEHASVGAAGNIGRSCRSYNLFSHRKKAGWITGATYSIDGGRGAKRVAR
jgi:hypothetical protein